MKFYNPFKPHIVSVQDYYLVRKLTLKGAFFTPRWEYLDSTGTEEYWWVDRGHVLSYCKINGLKNARDFLFRVAEWNKAKAVYVEG